MCWWWWRAPWRPWRLGRGACGLRSGRAGRARAALGGVRVAPGLQWAGDPAGLVGAAWRAAAQKAEVARRDAAPAARAASSSTSDSAAAQQRPPRTARHAGAGLHAAGSAEDVRLASGQQAGAVRCCCCLPCSELAVWQLAEDCARRGGGGPSPSSRSYTARSFEKPVAAAPPPASSSPLLQRPQPRAACGQDVRGAGPHRCGRGVQPAGAARAGPQPGCHHLRGQPGPAGKGMRRVRNAGAHAALPAGRPPTAAPVCAARCR